MQSILKRKPLVIIFLTLFLDLVGFSIIFPLFPQLAKYYFEVDRENYFLNIIFNFIQKWSQDGIQPIVIFGGILSALYSFLQFLTAPLWGKVSDIIGRRPVLLISVFFLSISYLLWFFSGSFTLLIFARLIGGIMSGNISTATAVVADVTDESKRSRGMAVIGIAFALGFIFGPALGGLLALIRLDELYPFLVDFGVNPFSVPALLAFVLSVFNFLFLVKYFKETLPKSKRGKSKSSRTINILKLFSPLPYKGVSLINFSYFFFLISFSGMEFTLTFLAFDRFGYTSLQNAYMFIFIGFILIFVQGGFVRRRAREFGEKNFVLTGLVSITLSLLIIGLSGNEKILYLGLFFLATGASMTIPCLTTLVSLYTPKKEQGHSIGIFRSLGALARVCGPFIASICYWQLGDQFSYFLGAFFLLLPIAMMFFLPNRSSEKIL